jgi:cytochrome P450 / NADPH-cytochrome P450 reductase
LSVFGQEQFFISSHELLNEVCDEKRFVKDVFGPLKQVRNGLKDGLFTAYYGEPAWAIAHRTLAPAFGPLGIKDMFDEMHDIAGQMVAKWARQGPDVSINVTDDFTRLTLDSIALCAMDKRFNSFYKEQMHPFVGAMVGFLAESGRRETRTRLERLLNPAPERQYQADIAIMGSVAAEVVAHRRSNPVDKKDLLNAMLLGKDPKTGQRLSDDNIMSNMLTFLVAGKIASQVFGDAS